MSAGQAVATVAIVVCGTMGTAAPATVVAREFDGANDASPFRSGIEVVSLNVSVTHAVNQACVADLARNEFIVYEDGRPQKITFFEAGTAPVDVALLVDASSSIESRRGLIAEAAERLIRTLRPVDRGAIVGFNDHARMLQPWTSDQSALVRAIAASSPEGNTSLYEALYVTLRGFEPARPEDPLRRRAIVVLSDGEDTSSLVSFETVLEEARRSGISIYTIAVASRAPRGVVFSARQIQAPFVMASLARETGGRAFKAERVEDLRGVYARIADELATQYAIGYVPRPGAGEFRSIVVQTTRPNTTARTRRGYYAVRSSDDGAGVGAAPLQAG